MKKSIAILASLILMSFTFTEAKATADEIPIEGHIQVYCWEASNQFDICPTVIMSLIWQESRGLHTNLTQVTNLKWFKEGTEYLKLDDAKNNQYQNVMLCGYYLKKYSDELGCMYCALQAWNEGLENSKMNHKDCRHHSYYARSIMSRSQEWEIIWYQSQRRIRP